jgi:hypothetical protein
MTADEEWSRVLVPSAVIDRRYSIRPMRAAF